jgi:hypothetical protein
LIGSRQGRRLYVFKKELVYAAYPVQNKESSHMKLSKSY